MAAVWTATSGRSASVVQALTEAAPTLAADGVNLDLVIAVLAVLHAPGVQTFTGVGNLLGYIWTGTLWARAPRADLDMADAAGLTDWTAPSLPVISARGRFMLVPSGVTLSGAGTTFTTEYFCVTGDRLKVGVAN